MYQLSTINFLSVLFYGIALSLSFSGLEIKKYINRYLLIFICFAIIQILSYLSFGAEFLSKFYPLLTHLPLFLLLKYRYKKNSYIAGISVLSAYLFCTPRKWIGTAVSYFWDYNIEISYLVQILVTIPLLIIILKYVSPYVVRLKFESNRILKLFISVPFIYYIIEYFLTVYTNLLYQGGGCGC